MGFGKYLPQVTLQSSKLQLYPVVKKRALINNNLPAFYQHYSIIITIILLSDEILQEGDSCGKRNTGDFRGDSCSQGNTGFREDSCGRESTGDLSSCVYYVSSVSSCTS
ncbi:hypothetical protein RCL_jg10830.t1 [Rhizophagus clarus]|uniref:Uncharacterized protein n=1 Tax=Rhizophagus clarus TaxID=94130 RepID=A0A8H3L7P9_9GLOM|nr:hypothetical protein RCL_jg10830.t1 [Rhizophagus clarus]